MKLETATRKQIVIQLKPRFAKAYEVARVDVLSGEFADAADACRDYCKVNGLTDSSVKVLWNWAGSAWDRNR